MSAVMAGEGFAEAELVRPDCAALASPESVRALITVRSPVDETTLGMGTDGRSRWPNLAVVAVAFTGYDTVDLKLCRQRRITVCNVPRYATDAVVELTIAMAIALLREVCPLERDLRRLCAAGEALGPWWSSVLPGRQISGRTVGIIGTGAIGCRVAEVFAALGSRIVGWARTKREAFLRSGGTYLSSPAEVCASSDLVSLHLPLNAETRGLIGRSELVRLRPGACLINVSRGLVIDREALLTALRTQDVRVALDVFDQEPPRGDDPLLMFPEKTLLTPHIGFKTREALLERARQTFENIRCALAGSPQNVVR